VNVLAFDYRGYGQSRREHPSEARWREDAEWALAYLTATRGVAAGSIVLDGRALGANLAVEVAAAHPELAGVVVEEPLEAPMKAVFGDARAGLVPAHLLVRDRWDTETAAEGLKTPLLWVHRSSRQDRQAGQEFYQRVTARKEQVWLTDSRDEAKNYSAALRRWMDDLRP
jgi:pimeloyl-ACP methyl ester carboxylesterase